MVSKSITKLKNFVMVVPMEIITESLLENLVHQKAYELGHFIHIDVCKPMNIDSNVGCRYYVLFKDDCTSY